MRLLRTSVFLLLVISMLVFAVTNVLPGDAATAILGRNASPDALAEFRRNLGLDRPAAIRYVEWLGGIFCGDLGHSVTAHRPVVELVVPRIYNSLVLAAIALFVMLPLGVGLGIVAGTKPGNPYDQIISTASLGLIAIPEFVIGTILILLFAIHWKLLPAVSLVRAGVDPLVTPGVLVLPAATLVLVGVPYVLRMVRAGIVEVMAADYIQMARLNGVPERQIILKHALPNSLAPTVQVVALTLQWLIGGAFVVETVFGYPGIGQGLVQAVSTRDIPLVQSVALLIAAAYIAVNLLSDFLIRLLIPRLRTAPS